MTEALENQVKSKVSIKVNVFCYLFFFFPEIEVYTVVEFGYGNVRGDSF
jgi:hypothetical protein